VYSIAENGANFRPRYDTPESKSSRTAHYVINARADGMARGHCPAKSIQISEAGDAVRRRGAALRRGGWQNASEAASTAPTSRPSVGRHLLDECHRLSKRFD